MDTALLESFLQVAQRLHFGHAAQELRLTQPALSHQVRRLERQVGAPLFERTSRQVRLTPAGAALVPHARRVLADLERAIIDCRAVAEGGVGHLRLGSIGAALNGIAPRLVRALRDQVPGLAVALSQLDTPVQLAALRARDLDLGLVRSAGQVAGVALQDLLREPMIVALPASHRLAQRGGVLAAAELAGEPFILWPRTTSALFYDQVLDYCRSGGFQPSVVMEGSDVETQLGLVSAGIGVSPQPASFANLRREGVAFRQLLAAPESTVQLAWTPATPPPYLELVRRLAVGVVRDDPAAGSA